MELKGAALGAMLRAGFPAVDTAPTYKNEAAVGAALQRDRQYLICKVPRRASGAAETGYRMTQHSLTDVEGMLLRGKLLLALVIVRTDLAAARQQRRRAAEVASRRLELAQRHARLASAVPRLAVCLVERDRAVGRLDGVVGPRLLEPAHGEVDQARDQQLSQCLFHNTHNTIETYHSRYDFMNFSWGAQ